MILLNIGRPFGSYTLGKYMGTGTCQEKQSGYFMLVNGHKWTAKILECNNMVQRTPSQKALTNSPSDDEPLQESNNDILLYKERFANILLSFGSKFGRFIIQFSKVVLRTIKGLLPRRRALVKCPTEKEPVENLENMEDDFFIRCPSIKSNKENVQRPKTKKVRFNLKPQVRLMTTWQFAHRKARKGHWEEMARDSERFKRHILFIGQKLQAILKPVHRSLMFRERFSTDSDIEFLDSGEGISNSHKEFPDSDEKFSDSGEELSDSDEELSDSGDDSTDDVDWGDSEEENSEDDGFCIQFK